MLITVGILQIKHLKDMNHFALLLSIIKLGFGVSVEMNGEEGGKILFTVPFFFKDAEW